MTEPKPDDSKKVKKAKFTNKKNFEVIEYEQEDTQYEDDDDEFIIPAPTNFEVKMSFACLILTPWVPGFSLFLFYSGQSACYTKGPGSWHF